MQTKNISIILFLGLLIGALFFLKHQNDSIKSTNPEQTDSAIKSLDPSASQKSIMSADIETSKNPVVDSSSLQTANEEQNLSLIEKKQLNTIEEIMSAKNDNDSRIDSELKNLSFRLKTFLIQKYKKLKPEMLNEKGFIAFLISREAHTPEDLDLLMTVIEEPPCLSLSDCAVAEKQVDPHHSGSDNITLQYPQMSTLYQIEQTLKKTNFLTPQMKNEYKNFLIKASNHPVETVSNKAKEIIKKYRL